MNPKPNNKEHFMAGLLSSLCCFALITPLILYYDNAYDNMCNLLRSVLNIFFTQFKEQESLNKSQ